MRLKEESERSGLRLKKPKQTKQNKTKIMTSSPITAWQIERKKLEVVTDFLFMGSKITADGDCIHETRRRLLLGIKAITNLSSVLKTQDITLPTEVQRSSQWSCMVEKAGQ